MGSNLRRIVMEYQPKKLEDGKRIGGKRRLTNARIDTIQFFYGRLLCDYKEYIPKMFAKMWAILGHYSSTIEKPLPNDYPTGLLM